MTIQIHGKGKVISICTVGNGEKCSVMETSATETSVWFGTVTICAEEESPKGKTIETTERYDKDGKIVEKIVREIPEDEKAKPYIAPWVYDSTISSGQIASISHAAQCAENAKAHANWASGCATSASTSAATAKLSESHG